MRNTTAKKILASIIALVLVLVLTVLSNRDISNSFLLYALLPGIIVNLLITGGHGGTIMEERVGLVAGVVVNCFVYAGIIFLLLRLKKSSKPM